MPIQARSFKNFLALLFLAIPAFATDGTFTDPRDGKKYKTVKIGKQIWMAENLNYNANGSKCYGEGGKKVLVGYDEKDEKIYDTLSAEEVQANCDKYGRLYDWKTAMKACPKGWHLPSNVEWDRLLHFVDGTSGSKSPYESKTAGKLLKVTKGWNDDKGKSGNGTDKYGFSALPGGHGSPGSFYFTAGDAGWWWSSTKYDGPVYGWGSTEYDASGANVRYITHDYESVDWKQGKKNTLFSVRCLQD